MNTKLSERGYSVLLSELPCHILKNIKSDLCVQPIENPNYKTGIKPWNIYQLSKTKIYLPRYYGIKMFGPPVLNTLNIPVLSNLNGLTISHPTISHPTISQDHDTLLFNGSMRPLQESVVDLTLKTLTDPGGLGSGVICLATGLGKTVVALNIVSKTKEKTLIIVHAEFLLEQWKTRIGQYLPNAKIGVIQQERCETDCDIVIGMLQTIISRDIVFESFGMMIIDECHHIAAKSFSGLFFKIQTKYILGLSATPDRKDGLTKVIDYFLGPQIVNIKTNVHNPSIQFLFTDTTHFVEKFNNLGKVNSPTMITDLTKNEQRNEQIILKIKELLKSNRKILVLTDRRDHCFKLKEYLDRSSSLDKSSSNQPITTGVYLGGMKQTERETTISASVIIGTYQAAGEGFDVPDLDTLIMATPKSDTEQAVGRILRQKNNNDPLVIDIVDSVSIFKMQYYKRNKFYKSKEWQILKK